MLIQHRSRMAAIAIDATYTVDPKPSGVSVYSRRLIESLVELESAHEFLICYRLSRWKNRKQFLRFRDRRKGRPSGEGKPPASRTCLFQEPWTFWLPWRAEIFHSLAQRPAPFRFHREIVTIHDVFPLTGHDYSTPTFQRKFSALLIEAAQRAARVITPSQYTADELARHVGVRREKICVIPEGVNLPQETLSPETRLQEREKWVGKGNALILVVGVIQTRKNTLGALRALEHLPASCRMVLAGGDGYGSEPVHEYVRQAGLRERVKILGHTTHANLVSLYQAANVMLFPSFEEGFGLPVLEAMAYGLPVVTSNASSLPEVGGEAALYVNPHDIADISDKTLQAIEDKELRLRMIRAGLLRAQEFSWRRAAEQTMRVYEQVLHEW